jgi:hypothetical protein
MSRIYEVSRHLEGADGVLDARPPLKEASDVSGPPIALKDRSESRQSAKAAAREH